MKKVILCSLAVATMVMSDPAKKVELSLSNDTLTVTVDHPTRNVKKHYISEVDIAIGDSTITEKSYKEQTNKEQLIDIFVLPQDLLVDGAKISAETTCNKYGTKIGTLTVGAKK